MIKVSIVIPTYERAHYLSQLLNTISKQTFKDYEVIIIDDCSKSKKEYEAVIDQYANIIENITYKRTERNYGTPTHARNVGVKMAKGKFIAFCDDDDEWYPQKLELQVKRIEMEKEMALVYTWADAIDASNGEVIDRYRGELEGDIVKELLKKNFIPTSSVLVRRAALMKAGGMDENMRFCCEDWDTWIRILKEGNSCGVVKQVLLKYYRRSGECFSMLPDIQKGYLQFYKKNWKYAMKVSPIIVLLYVKHIVAIYMKKLLLNRN